MEGHNHEDSLTRLKEQFHATMLELRKIEVEGIGDYLDQVDRFAGEIRRRNSALSAKLSEAELALSGNKKALLEASAELDRRKDNLERQRAELERTKSELQQAMAEAQETCKKLAGFKLCKCKCGLAFMVDRTEFGKRKKIICPGCGLAGEIKHVTGVRLNSILP